MSFKKYFPLFSTLLILTLLFGCVGGSTNPTNNNNTNNTATCVITGSLHAGTISSSSVKTSSTGIRKMADAGQPEAGSIVMAANIETNEVFLSDATDAQGNFNINVEPGTYYLEIVDDGKDKGPVTVGISPDNKPYMGVEVNSSTVTASLGNIVHDDSQDYSAVEIENTNIIDESTKVRGDGSKPIGAENYGKSVEAKAAGTLKDTCDPEDDGRHNKFDADSNGNGIPDNRDEEADSAGDSPSGAHAWFFMNLKVDNSNRNTYKTSYGDFVIALGVELIAPKSNSIGTLASTKTISSVFVIDGPPWLDKAKVNSFFGPGGQESTLFKDQDYEIKYSNEMKRHEVFLSGIKPITDVNAGDVLTIRINYSDNTYEIIQKFISEVFTEIPLLSSYSLDGGVTWHDVALLDNSNPIANTNTKLLYLRWLRPKNEKGEEIINGRYTWEYSNNGGGAGEVEVVADDPGTSPYVEGHYNMSTLSNMTLGPQNEMMIGICLRSPGNDNAANNIRMIYTP